MPDPTLSPALYGQLADAVVVVHLAIVCFVVFGLVLVVIGNLLRWRWVNAWWFRLAHIAAIAIVVGEAWLGITCPLTTLEVWLREQAHQAAYSGGFIENGLRQALYYDAPPWVFTLAYTLFGAAVAAAWWRWPPRTRHGGHTHRSS